MSSETLTVESLERAIVELMGLMEHKDKVIALKPTTLIVPPFLYHRLMKRPPIRIAIGMRKRKRAISQRPTNALRKMMR